MNAPRKSGMKLKHFNYFFTKHFFHSLRGQVCGGESRGKCNCGVCECQAEFTGKTCECSNLETHCIAPGSDKVCSGHGSCDCNECKCKEPFSGKFCESSPGNESLNSLCIFYEPCVQCVINRKLGRDCSDYKDKCSSSSGELYKSEFFDDIPGEL